MPNPALEVIDLIELKALLGYTDDTKDAKLQLLAEAAEAFVKEITGRNPLNGTAVTETLTGDDTDLLMLSQYPVTSITSLTIEGDALVLTGDDRQVLVQRGGFVKRLDGKWPSTPPEAIVITYGIKGIGRDLVVAMFSMIEWRLGTIGKGSFKSESIGNYRYELGTLDEVPGLRDVLNRYRDPVKMVK